MLNVRHILEKLNSNKDNSKVVEAFYSLKKVLSTIFYESDNIKSNSGFIFGSYQRKTNISDNNINFLFILPPHYLESDKSPSEEILNSDLMIENGFSCSIANQSKFVHITSDQGVIFNLLPVFQNLDDTFTFKVSEAANLWSIMDPISENIAFREFYLEYNNLPILLSKLVRLWVKSVDIDFSGYLTDTLVYHFFKLYKPSDIAQTPIETVFKLFITFLIKQDKNKFFWKCPGSSHSVAKTDEFHIKAELTLDIINSNDPEQIDRIFNFEKTQILQVI